MISDNQLYSLAIFLGSAAMLMIVLYHFLEVNAQDDDASVELEDEKVGVGARAALCGGTMIGGMRARNGEVGDCPAQESAISWKAPVECHRWEWREKGDKRWEQDKRVQNQQPAQPRSTGRSIKRDLRLDRHAKLHLPAHQPAHFYSHDTGKGRKYPENLHEKTKNGHPHLKTFDL